MESLLESRKNKAKPMKLKEIYLSRSRQVILRNLNAEFPSTGVTVLLGANGAGKSSLLNAISGISALDSGEVQVSGGTSVCLMPEPAVFYPHLKVHEQLSFTAELFEVENPQQHIAKAMKIWHLEAMKNKLTQHLSLGYRQRLSLAQLTVSQADLWLLDEPMNGMDPEVLTVFKQQVLKFKSSVAIIMATHIMYEAQELADWVVVMHQGQIIYSEAYDNSTSFYELYQQAIQSNQQAAS